MALMDGYTDVPPGKLAFVVTSLEMLAPPPPRPATVDRGLAVRRVRHPDAAWYRDLFRRVGEPWLWFSRLRLAPDALEDVLRRPGLEIYALTSDGIDEGLLELDFSIAGACELAFFGLVPGRIGQGAGRFLMQHAVATAWSRPIERFWVHTCTGDHPGALAFYMRSGFRPYRRQIEIADDPRLAGLLPMTAAPHVPVIG